MHHEMKYHGKIEAVIANINKVIMGKEEVSVLSLTALLAGGHVLLEDVPGVGKTMLVRVLAKSLDCDFRRIQFTPDLLPSDVTGISIYNPKAQEFKFMPGPIFGNIVLADEINRTSAKTQSSLLEAMEEKSVTIDGDTLPLKQPFFVMATQNPIEYEGTYQLPEAQLDRFTLKLHMGYPSYDDELNMLTHHIESSQTEDVHAVMSKEELLNIQEEVKDVYIDGSLKGYIVNIARATRENAQIRLGVSPRGSISLMKASQALAYIYGRDYVLPDDVKYLAPYVFPHRIILSQEAAFSGRTNEEIIHHVLEGVDIPIRKEFTK